jgi:hypothetical protein
MPHEEIIHAYSDCCNFGATNSYRGLKMHRFCKEQVEGTMLLVLHELLTACPLQEVRHITVAARCNKNCRGPGMHRLCKRQVSRTVCYAAHGTITCRLQELRHLKLQLDATQNYKDPGLHRFCKQQVE